MRRKIYRIWQEFSHQMNEHHISAYASSAAFFTFLSLIPMLLLLISAIPYTPITKATLMMFVTKILPQNMEPLSVSIIDEVYEKTGTAPHFRARKPPRAVGASFLRKVAGYG